MFTRSIVRFTAALLALVAGLAVSARAALAARLPDPLGPTPGAGSGPVRPQAVAVAPGNLEVLGMGWQLALAIAILALAAALLLATALQRRHAAHA